MSFYISLNGMKNAQTSLGVISHNIANAESYGFKRGRAQFSELVAISATSDPKIIQGVGASVAGVTQNFGLGPLEQTGSALDVAITGDGFFATRNTDGKTVFTRAGQFQIDGQGFLTNNEGARLQSFPTDATGTITGDTPVDTQIPAKNAAGATYSGISIAKDGAITASYDDGSVSVIGSIAIANFMAPSGLRSIGNSSWTPTGQSGAAEYGNPGSGSNGSLLSGSLERSNVDIAEELVGLITAQRNFQANAKAIDTNTQLSQTVINLRS